MKASYLRLIVMMPDSTHARRGSALRYVALQNMLMASTARMEVRTTPFALSKHQHHACLLTTQLVHNRDVQALQRGCHDLALLLQSG